MSRPDASIARTESLPPALARLRERAGERAVATAATPHPASPASGRGVERPGFCRWLAMGFFVATIGLAGCRGDDAGKSDEAVLVMLSEARAHQRLADLRLADGDVEGAIAAVREVLGIRFPPGAPETEDVFLDAHARLARLLLSRGGAEAEDQALTELETARRLATRDSFFRAHVENITADVYAARAKRLTDPAAQKQAARLEAQALERVIEIDRRLQHALFNTREPARDK